MKKVYYEKIGRRYRPVAEYDSDLLDSFHRGSHLVCVYPGGQSRRFNVEPNHAAMIAAGRVAEDAMCKAINKASELRPQRTPITPGQQRAWKKLAKEFGDELCTLNGASTRDIAEAGVKVMQEEADKLMSHPAVVDAWEKFMLTCELTKERENGN
jgi:hypothetical protein